MALDLVAAGNRREMREFVEFPYRLYRRDPFWIPPLRIAQKELLDIRKHPFYAHAQAQCFLARQNGETVGRVAAIYDRSYNEFHREETGFFGFYESVDEQPVADVLLNAAREWLQKRGARTILGPMSPSTNYECGLLVDGFDSSPQIMMTYNPPYYAEQIERAGLRKAKDLYAYGNPVSVIDGEKAERVSRRAENGNHFRIRTLRMNAFDEEAAILWDLYNAAWSRNWGFVPMSRDEFFFMAHDLKQIAVPDLLLIGEVKERPAAFALALPDINQALKHAHGRLFPLGLFKILHYKRFINSVRVLTLGVREEYRNTGVAAGLYAALIRNARRLKYKFCELSWVLEDNLLMNRSIEALGARRYKTYRIYEWN